MGEARNRGSYDQRRLEAAARKLERRRDALRQQDAIVKFQKTGTMVVKRPHPDSNRLKALDLNADRRAQVVAKILGTSAPRKIIKGD